MIEAKQDQRLPYNVTSSQSDLTINPITLLIISWAALRKLESLTRMPIYYKPMRIDQLRVFTRAEMSLFLTG